MKKKYKITLLALGALVLIWVAYNAYLPINGYVVDAETGKPIEGVVVLAWWSISEGPVEMLSSRYYRMEEVLTDQNGRFRLGTIILNPFVNKPNISLYKAGYVSWNSRIVFPAMKFREGFMWGGGQTYALEIFKPGYSYADHVSFIDSSNPPLDAKSVFEKAYEWERLLRQKEWKEKK